MADTDLDGCPVFVDGELVCEATDVSYERNVPVATHMTPSVADDPISYVAQFSIPDDVEFHPDRTSRVEIALPPAVHGMNAWHVFELWELSEITIDEATVELAARCGDLHTGVNYLGDDVMRATDDGTLVDPEQGVVKMIDIGDEESQ